MEQLNFHLNEAKQKPSNLKKIKDGKKILDVKCEEFLKVYTSLDMENEELLTRYNGLKSDLDEIQTTKVTAILQIQNEIKNLKENPLK